MDYREARRRLQGAAWNDLRTPVADPMLPQFIELLLRYLRNLPGEAVPITFALILRLRKLADEYEVRLFEELREVKGLSWAEIAVVIESDLASRQAVQQRYGRLTVSMARGHEVQAAEQARLAHDGSTRAVQRTSNRLRNLRDP